METKALPDILPGDIAIHHNGTIARVIFAPTENEPLIGVAFWIDDDDLTEGVMQMAWHLEWLKHVERNGVIVWGRGAVVQLELWSEVA